MRLRKSTGLPVLSVSYCPRSAGGVPGGGSPPVRFYGAPLSSAAMRFRAIFTRCNRVVALPKNVYSSRRLKKLPARRRSLASFVAHFGPPSALQYNDSSRPQAATLSLVLTWQGIARMDIGMDERGTHWPQNRPQRAPQKKNTCHKRKN